MAEQEQPALEDMITPNGDLSKPIPPGMIFGTLRSEDEFKKIKGNSELSYPPVPEDNPGYEFDPGKGTMTATIWGKAALTDKGITVIPSWNIPDDKMRLEVQVDDVDFAGETVTNERLLKYLPKELEGLDLDLDIKAIDDALEQAAKTGNGVTATVLKGDLPGKSQDARLKLYFNIDQAAGTLRKDGTMDFRERASLHAVSEGDLLGELYPPIHGSMGHDIFGNPIMPREPQKAKVNLSQGVKSHLGENAVTVYSSTRPGVVRFRRGILEVVDLLEIKGDVDFKTGNIRADQGSIHISGDVKPGFTVESYGDVIIDGVVEEADITAGGLVIAGGVIMVGNNKIIAKDNVSAHFLRNATVEAGGDVIADLEISHSKVIADGQILVLGDKGIISGGHVISGTGIHANIIGNKASTETFVEIRALSPKKKMLEASRKQLEDELEILSKAIGSDDALASLMNAPDEDRRILAELIKVRGSIQTDLRDLNETIKEIHEETKSQLASKRIKANHKVFCGTEVIIGGKKFKPEENMVSPCYYLDLDTQQIAFD